MAKLFDLEIITPLKTLFKAKVRHVRLPGVEGYFGVLAGHAPFITTLRTGTIKVDLDDKQTIYFSTSGGIVEVLPHVTTILAETAEEASQIDLERALTAKERAEKRLAEKDTATDIERARKALAKAENRIEVAEKVKKKR